jgi:hypothetical protein
VRKVADDEPARVSVWLSRVLFLLVIYAVMPDVFAPYWCVEVEPTGHECRWPINLFVHRVASAPEGTKNVARDHRERSDDQRATALAARRPPTPTFRGVGTVASGRVPNTA